jgi:hypothetical protein
LKITIAASKYLTCSGQISFDHIAPFHKISRHPAGMSILTAMKTWAQKGAD